MNAWQLIATLIEEATGMTGDELVDKVRIERGAGYVRDFKKAYPLWAFFIDNLINGTPEQARKTLAAFNPQAANLPLLTLFLAQLQKQLRGK
jgi:hypothetical protein